MDEDNPPLRSVRTTRRRARRTARHRARPTRGSRVRGLMRLLAAMASTVVLGATAFGFYASAGLESGFFRSDAISDEDARALDGDLNILLIGLDTRKDFDGKDLAPEILSALHAGDSDVGGYNANSLILVHIPKDLSKIVAFSIPRDNYVAVSGIPGYKNVKIKEAYGLKKAAVEQDLRSRGVTDEVELEHRSREAGRASIVQTVRTLTGVPINRFAEISLAGFYDLANAVGGVDVCLNNAVDDSTYSGAKFPAGRQHLDGAQALAFVRQRHGLPNGDLDRTRRQQAFLMSVAKSLEDSGTFTDLRRLGNLVDVAHKDTVLSTGWNLLDFASVLGRAGAIPVEFRTLPILRYDNVNGQDVNIVDPDAIKREVRTAFGMPPPDHQPSTATTPSTAYPSTAYPSTAYPSTTAGSAEPSPNAGKPVIGTIGDGIPCVN
ncbi:LCP family protein [Nocardia uniformis]|uniref:LCP family protein n=1 Tax=Nocardia uniformis TaxID=53432 RepID=A0A849BV51_9NOCA|nr:LCP family protein [Nocardia uniformis]NNH68786.1 LCP family protein [Nocardia uniformis]